jgi:hypothetical protein
VLAGQLLGVVHEFRHGYSPLGSLGVVRSLPWLSASRRLKHDRSPVRPDAAAALPVDRTDVTGS